MNHKKRNLAVGGAVLAGVSYLAGILTAPKSGRETRKDINKAAHKAMTDAERHLKTAHSELTGLLGVLGKQAEKGKDLANKELKAALAQAETVKTKTRELISAIHEGEAADKDLDVAVKEAKAAVQHLKSFVVKKK
jgi:gas vesicle protein